MLLGLVNKIYHAELFIGVGDQYPHLLDGARALVPGLTRQLRSAGTALGEISFGMLLLVGVFDKITTMALTLIFTSFVFTFGMVEIVHLYPIAGFAVLFFRAPPGTAIDGVLFRILIRGCGRRLLSSLGSRRVRARAGDRRALLTATVSSCSSRSCSSWRDLAAPGGHVEAYRSATEPTTSPERSPCWSR